MAENNQQLTGRWPRIAIPSLSFGIPNILANSGKNPVIFFGRSICHVLEFEDIYREEAAQRKADGQKSGGGEKAREGMCQWDIPS